MDDDPAGGGLAPPGPPAHGLTAVEPFVGAGGMAEGLRRAGFRSLWAGDMEPRSVATAKAALEGYRHGFAPTADDYACTQCEHKLYCPKWG